jgi:ferredoxin
MAKLTIEGARTVDVPAGTRLVRAIQGAGVDILHRCGGNARCTTCRVEFLAGEPDRMTVAEHDKLLANGELGQFRLSCQCLVADGMSVRPLLRLSGSGLDDAGPEPEDFITPEPVWRDRAVVGVGDAERA